MRPALVSPRLFFGQLARLFARTDEYL